MNDRSHAFVSVQLNASQMREAMKALPSILQAELPADLLLKASYGFGCKLHPDLCYRDMQVGISWLAKFIEDSLASIVVPAHSDFEISIPDGRLCVLFCHEGDIHTKGTAADLQERLWHTPPFDAFTRKCPEDADVRVRET